MYICPKDTAEMFPQRNGVAAVWHGRHAKVGDRYECPKCGHQVLHITSEAFQVDEVEIARRRANDTIVEMPS